MIKDQIKKNPILGRLKRDAIGIVKRNRKNSIYAGVGVVILLIYAVSKMGDSPKTVYRYETPANFKKSSILDNQKKSILAGKERLLNRSTRELLQAQKELKNEVIALRAEIEQVKNMEKGNDELKVEDLTNKSDEITETRSGISLYPPPNSKTPSSFRQGGGQTIPGQTPFIRSKGPSTIQFPVKDKHKNEDLGVVLPSGSYVKSKLLTGIEAPEGKNYPVLLQLDYAFIGPNQRRVDLSGCFMIAKAQGNLSTERVEMQATKMSCVSKSGRMFEREVNGWSNDDKDNAYGIIGSVNSKQDRVAATAFLASIVEGVGKAIQQAQTTQQASPLGGGQSIVTGNQAKYMAAGGASNAASMITQWYLKQAQNLLPTINVGSGQDVWIVMKDKTHLPQEFFEKSTQGEKNEPFSFYSRVLN